MGYNISKRISVLRKQADESQTGRWSFLRVVILMFFFLGGITFFVLRSAPEHEESSSSEDLAEVDHWEDYTTKQFYNRLRWLKESPLVLTPRAANMYANFGRSIVEMFPISREKSAPDAELVIIDFEGMKIWLGRAVIGALLRSSFVLIAFWPFWLISIALALIYVRIKASAHKGKSVLAVCDRSHGPFYSGIYGPFRPNNNPSATDFSCPGLACPRMAKRKTAENHPIARLLRKHDALNETNLGLLRVILAHGDFPSHVEDENTEQHEIEHLKSQNGSDRKSQTGFVTNDDGTILESVSKSLPAVLEAFERLSRYIESLEGKGIKSPALNKNYQSHIKHIEKLSSGCPPLAKTLIHTLTPNRIWAIGHLKAAHIASAFLAIEAGKSLVFERHGRGFSKISHYPHLQARAVLHSLNSYHTEYKGDIRLIIRQAVICSRRHGDFGRAFLPYRMPLEGRVIRDWLEILYSVPQQQQNIANLVELDAHLEEISVNWKIGLYKKLETIQGNIPEDPLPVEDYPFWKGIVYKSVILMPLQEVITLALRGIHPTRANRISELLVLTRKHQTSISISARLPGFKRQAMEADLSSENSDPIIQSLLSGKNGKQLVNRWRIVRRMLTRYNWLSTRVGDDAVPIAGLLEAILCNREEPSRKTINFPALAPIRQRRFQELFGGNWESTLYADSPNPDTLEIYVEHKAFEDALENNTSMEETTGEQTHKNGSPSVASA